MAVKSLFYCSEASVRVAGVKSQWFTVGVALRQEHVPSPIIL